MKAFARHRTFNEVKALCKEQRLQFSDRFYEAGGDEVIVEGGGCAVVFNVASGFFCGKTPDGIQFSSLDDVRGNEPWFQALLDFFYTDEPEVVEVEPEERVWHKGQPLHLG